MGLSKTNGAVVLIVGFVNYLEWAIVMTTIYPYILSLSKDVSSATVYLSLAQSLFPLGQGISQPVASLLVKKMSEIKFVLVASLVIAIGGNVTYMAAEKAGSVALIIVGRALAGFGAGSGGVAYGFIGANTSRENRVKMMSYYRVVCMIGVMFSTIASATFLPDFARNAIGKSTKLNEFTAPAALTILFLCISLILVVFVLNEADCSPVGEAGDGGTLGQSLKSRGVLLGLMLYFLNGYVTTWVGYIMPLVAFNHFHFNVHEFGWLMVGVSGVAAVSSFTMAFLSKSKCMANSKLGDWRIIIACYSVMLVAIILGFLGGPSLLKTSPLHTREGLFISGVILVFLTYSVAGVILPSMTTKYVAKAMMVGTAIALPKAVWKTPVIMPYCIASMSVGKVIAPLVSKAELTIQGWELLFVGTLAFTLLGLVLFAYFFRAPEPEETPLLPATETSAARERTMLSAEQGIGDSYHHTSEEED